MHGTRSSHEKWYEHDLYSDINQKRTKFNPHLPNGFSHLYQLDESIFHLRSVWCMFFILFIFFIEIPVSKQCRPWSDAAFCGIWSGSALFAYVPKMRRQAYMDKFILQCVATQQHYYMKHIFLYDLLSWRILEWKLEMKETMVAYLCTLEYFPFSLVCTNRYPAGK